MLIIKRWITVLALLVGLSGIAGLAVWNSYKVRAAAVQNHVRWVQGLSKLVVAERRSLTRWVNEFPTDPPLMSRLARANPAIDVLYLIDHATHQTARWVRPSVEDRLETIDPRLIVLELNALESGMTQMGPVVFIDGISHATVVRPLNDQQALLAIIRAPGISRIFREEARIWGRDIFVHDYEGNPIFVSTASAASAPMVRAVMEKVHAGLTSGKVPLERKEIWRRLATFHYDRESDWVFIVAEPMGWAYAPLIPFFLSLLGIVMLKSVSSRLRNTSRRQQVSHHLRQFAARADRFIRGKDKKMADPLSSVPELKSVAQNLRWIVPEWKKAQALTRELDLDQKLLSLLVESLPEGILFFNSQGGLQLSNELGRAFLTLQQEIGREYRVVNEVRIPRGFLEPFLDPVFTGRQKNLGKEFEATWAESRYLYRAWVECVENADGKVDGFMVVIRDITFRKQWEYVQEQVLSGITHDLRGPLSAMMGYLDLMRRQVKEDELPKVAEYIRVAREAGVRLTQMVSDILDVVRFEQGKIDLEISAIPVKQIFDRLQNLFSVVAQEKKVALKFDGDTVLEEDAWGDPKLLARVFDNLVSNAIKFTPDGGTITVSARREPGRLIFEVRDTGRGIPREAQSRIFDKFQQVRPGDRSSGYGLGLAVAKFIVDAHKGEIRVESEIEHGSRFTFWIPDAAQPSDRKDRAGIG